MFGPSTHQVPQHDACRRHHRYRQISVRLAALFFTIVTLLTLSGTRASYAASNAVTWPLIHLQPFASGFDSPIDIESAYDGTGRLFVLEQGGIISIIDNGVRLTNPFLSISGSVATCNECGLLGIAFPPDFADKGYFFINYTNKTSLVAGDTGDPDGANDTVIARYHVSNNANRADANSKQNILVINQPAENHNGGHILFGPDGYLYIGMGDGGGGDDGFKNAQNHASLLGKILRIQVGETGTYTVPATNPFIHTAGYRPEIWATGVRNPWRYGFDRTTGDFYLADVGQDVIEEVNHIAAGDIGNGGFNFGWPIMEGNDCHQPNAGATCDLKGLTPPVATYNHNPDGCSITGGFVFHSSEASQAPVYLYGDYCSGNVWGLQADGDEWASLKLNHFNLSITSFGEDEDGTLYLVNRDGTIFQIAETPLSHLYLPGLVKQH